MRIINPRLDYAGLQIQRDKRDKIKKQRNKVLLSMKKAYFYGFRTKTVRFWDGNRKREGCQKANKPTKGPNLTCFCP